MRCACDENGPEPAFGNARRVLPHLAGGISSETETQSQFLPNCISDQIGRSSRNFTAGFTSFKPFDANVRARLEFSDPDRGSCDRNYSNAKVRASWRSERADAGSHVKQRDDPWRKRVR